MNVKVLKSFVSAHDAVNWASQNRIEDTSIETTGTLKSMGMGPVPSGNYHVVLKGKRFFKLFDRFGKYPKLDSRQSAALVEKDAENRQGRRFLSDELSAMGSDAVSMITGGKVQPFYSNNRAINIPDNPNAQGTQVGTRPVNPDKIQGPDESHSEAYDRINTRRDGSPKFSTSMPIDVKREAAEANKNRTSNNYIFEQYGLEGSNERAADEQTANQLVRDNLHPGEARRLAKEMGYDTKSVNHEDLVNVITKAVMDVLKAE